MSTFYRDEDTYRRSV